MSSARIYIRTFGCSANLADSEAMAGILAKEYKLVDNPDTAGIIILNICTVKGNSAALREIRDAAAKKKVIVAGCIPADLVKDIERLGKISLVSTHNIARISEAVKETLADKRIYILGGEAANKLAYPRIRKNKCIAIIPISSGCVGSCSYCSVRLLKGDICSYPMRDIINEAKKAIKEGYKELWITSQDNSAYMLDKEKKTVLPKLITQLCEIEGNFFIRVGMMNPNNILPVLDKLIESYSNPKVFKFLHIPVQSGSDRVLKDMNRKYTTAQFKEIVTAFRKVFPMITISTDIITGYPTEKEADHKATVKLLKEIMPDLLHRSRFRPRPGTGASKLNLLPTNIVKERSIEIAYLHKRIALENNKKWVGSCGPVLIDEKGKCSTMIARNSWYKQIILSSGKPGDLLNVKISSARNFDLIGIKLPRT